MIYTNKLVVEEDKCAISHVELSKYLIQDGVFSNLHVNTDQDRLNYIEWLNMYGSVTTQLHKLAIRVLSHVISSFRAEKCWSTYSYLHNVKRNNLNENWAESLVFVLDSLL